MEMSQIAKEIQAYHNSVTKPLSFNPVEAYVLKNPISPLDNAPTDIQYYFKPSSSLITLVPAHMQGPLEAKNRGIDVGSFLKTMCHGTLGNYFDNWSNNTSAVKIYMRGNKNPITLSKTFPEKFQLHYTALNIDAADANINVLKQHLSWAMHRTYPGTPDELVKRCVELPNIIINRALKLLNSKYRVDFKANGGTWKPSHALEEVTLEVVRITDFRGVISPEYQAKYGVSILGKAVKGWQDNDHDSGAYSRMFNKLVTSLYRLIVAGYDNPAKYLYVDGVGLGYTPEVTEVWWYTLMIAADILDRHIIVNTMFFTPMQYYPSLLAQIESFDDEKSIPRSNNTQEVPLKEAA